jgi:hypothetical protein
VPFLTAAVLVLSVYALGVRNEHVVLYSVEERPPKKPAA